jgi:hypothetical protein
LPKRKPFTYIHLPPDFAPKYCTLDEACSYARHARWHGHMRIKQGRWRAFKDGRRTVIEFDSVVEDEERLQAENGIRPKAALVVKKTPVGRPHKPKPKIDAPAHAAE